MNGLAKNDGKQRSKKASANQIKRSLALAGGCLVPDGIELFRHGALDELADGSAGG